MAEEQKQKRVLLIYRKMIPPIRLCGHSQMEYLAQLGLVEYRAVQEMKLRRSDVEWADIVMLGRFDSWYECRLTKCMKEAGCYLIYIIDDDLLSIPPEVSSSAYYARKEIARYISTMIQMSDAIVSPSPDLLSQYAVNGRKAILIEEPAVDPVQFEPHPQDTTIKIGFAGSVDRTQDLEYILRDPLIQIFARYGQHVKMEFFGCCPSFAREVSAVCIPYSQSYEEYRKTLNDLKWDIGLAPVPETHFHRCKHYNKYIEYAAAGTLCLCSDLQPYIRLKGVISPDLFVPNSTKAWMERLERLIDDYAYREDLRRQAVVHAQGQFGIDSVAKLFWNQLAQIQTSVRKRFTCHLWFLKVGNMASRLLWGIRKYGRKLTGMPSAK